jgi:hypothetical protein
MDANLSWKLTNCKQTKTQDKTPTKREDTRHQSQGQQKQGVEFKVQGLGLRRVERLAVAEGDSERGWVGGWEGARDTRADSDAAAGGEQEEEEERRKKDRKLVAALGALEEEVQALRKERGISLRQSLKSQLHSGCI